MTRELPKFLTQPNPEVYNSENYVVLDFETTVRSKGTALDYENRIVLAVWRLGAGHPDSGIVPNDGVTEARSVDRVKWAGEYALEQLVREIEKADFLVAHNAKFELQWLERCGLDTSEVLVWDTMIGDYVIGGNRWVGHALSLQNCATRRYGEGKMDIISKMYKSGLCSTDIPRSWLQRYCVQDVDLTHRLFLDQREEMQGTRLLPVMYTRCLATPVLADLEKNGMQVDGHLVRTRLKEVEREFADQEQILERMTGGINLNSPKQLGEFLYDTLRFEEKRRKQGGKWVPDRTPSGGRKTDAATTASLKGRTKEQGEFLDAFRRYKELYNELTKYLRKFADCAEHDGGLLHASFNQTNTQTHRLSSTGTRYSTQFQNFPRAYKPLFEAREQGWLMGECDGSQLEFRVAAHLGRDGVALDDIISGTDIHSVTAKIIGVSRQDAKAHTFKPLYGGQSGTSDEKRYYSYFREHYEGIAGAQQRWVDDVLSDKSLETEWGLRFYWPNTRMDRSGYVTNTTSICNYPVQSFATAEIIPIALVYFWHRLRRGPWRMFLVNTIHDSIIAELPAEEVEDFHSLSEQCLIKDVYPYLEAVYGVRLTVPLGAGVKVASHWSGSDASDHVPSEIDHDNGEVSYVASKDLYAFGV